MTEQIERIIRKINELRQADKNFVLFGAKDHKYILNPTLSEEEIKSLEIKHNINLPIEYKEFLNKIGNGFIGPAYGLEPFGSLLFDDFRNMKQDPSKPFVHTDKWYEEFIPTVDMIDDEEEFDRQEEEFNEGLMNGAIAICNYGCGILINLVVNGSEYGNIWVDDRSNEQGIYPLYEYGNKEKTTFLNWYEKWLDDYLLRIKK